MSFNGQEMVGEWMPPPESGTLPIEESVLIEQIRANCKLDLPLLNIQKENDKTMVMVCGGPTSKQLLEEIREKRQDDNYRIFCSNKTHDWLIENGIVPHYQFIIDPKEVKIKDVQNPHKDVEYLIGITVHPSVFEALKGYKVTRVMSLSGTTVDGISDIQIVSAFFNVKDWTPLEGGTMAGLRAMTLANMMGYRTVEFYGFDSCFFDKDEKGKPIYYSYKKDRGENILECECDDGRTFLSTPVFASQAREFIKWKHRLAWVKFIIHGDSFTAHINKLDEEAFTPKHNLLITDYMLSMNKKLFSKSKNEYGVSGSSYAGEISLLAGQLAKKYGEITLLDYGCGQRTLEASLPPITGLKISAYDPCIDEVSKHPDEAFDMVVCTDVLEHIEAGCLENVLDDLQRLTKKICYVSICLTPAQKKYSDGRNCHLSLLDHEIWYAKLRKRFHVNEQKRTKSPGGHDILICILQAREVK